MCCVTVSLFVSRWEATVCTVYSMLNALFHLFEIGSFLTGLMFKHTFWTLMFALSVYMPV